jgi:lipoprotein-releasing system ATP-binding protein
MGQVRPLLQLTEVTRSYEAAGRAPLTVLDNISLEVQAGESLAIIGPSGSGKSTLLHLMGALDRPTRGTVQLDGQDLARLDADELAALRSRRIGFVFQAHYLLPQCTVLENVLVPTLAVRGRKSAPGQTGEPESAEARARRLLARVGLGERLGHRPGELSGGEQQRVAVVRALINRPLLVLADEPTGALDPAAARQLGQVLVELNREEAVTLIVVTHAHTLAHEMGRRLTLEKGRLVAGDTGG